MAALQIWRNDLVEKRDGITNDQASSESSSQQLLAPDLAVTDPKTSTTKYVEVKFRSARPMSVILERARLEDIRRYYPETILIFVSAYDGSVNCANVDEISDDK